MTTGDVTGDVSAAVDTSVLVPALLADHEHHVACRVLVRGAAVPVHVLLESFSVLTRLPQPRRLAATTAAHVLGAAFQASAVLTPTAGSQRTMVARLAGAGVVGGAVYDGLVAITTDEQGYVLLTRDRRAIRTYDVLGIDYRLVGNA